MHEKGAVFFWCMLLESFPVPEEHLGISTARPAKAPTPLPLPSWRKSLLSALTTAGRCCCAPPADEQCGGPVCLWQPAVATEGLQICRRLCPGDRPQPSTEPEDSVLAPAASGSHPILSPEHLRHGLQFQAQFFTGGAQT